MEIERKQILNKKLAIQKKVKRTIDTIIRMSEILKNPLSGDATKRAATKTIELKSLQLKELVWQFHRFI